MKGLVKTVNLATFVFSQILKAHLSPYVRYLYREGVVLVLLGIARASVLVFPGCLKVRGFFWSDCRQNFVIFDNLFISNLLYIAPRSGKFLEICKNFQIFVGIFIRSTQRGEISGAFETSKNHQKVVTNIFTTNFQNFGLDFMEIDSILIRTVFFD